MHTDPDKLTGAVKKLAKEEGFNLVGISSAEPLTQAGQRLRRAVQAGCTAGMTYLQRNPAQRVHPKALFPWARSIICVGLNYHFVPLSTTKNHRRLLISRYALGRDYHLVLAEKLQLFKDKLPRTIHRGFRSHLAVDTSALMEKPLAQRAGLGWQGKNSLVINPEYGSWIFLGELLSDLDLTPDTPAENQCGSCTACIDACPTGALAEPHLLDARKCLSYLTVEHKGPVPAGVLEKANKKNVCIYGCDICQEVCPFNQDTPQTKERQFHPRDEILNLSLDDLLTMSEAEFEKVFSDAPLARLSYRQFRRNVQLLKKA